MPLAYGNTLSYGTPHINYKFEKQKKQNERSSGYTGLFRILITILEVGAAIVAPESIALQIGVGLGAAAANTALSAKENNVTGIGLALDWSSAFIPAIGAARTASRIGRATASDLARAGETAYLASQEEMMENAAFNVYRKELLDAKRYATAATKTDKKMDEAIKYATELSQKARTGTLTEAERKAMDYMTVYDLDAEARGYAREFQELRTAAGAKYDASEALIQNEIQRMKDAFEQIRNLPMAARVSESKFLREAEKLVGEGKRNLIRELYLTPQKGWAKTASGVAFKEHKIRSITLINEAMKKLSENGKDLFSIFLRRINFIETMDKKAVEEELAQLFESLSQSDKLVFVTHINKDEFINSFTIFTRQADQSTARRWIKFAGSSRFNKRVVQIAQLVDPNDMGRAIPEMAYQFTKDKILRKYERNTVEKAIVKAEKMISRSAKVEEAFVKSGGELLASRYIIGFKVLPGGYPGRRLVLVKFNKAATATKSGRNEGGKQDILVSMSDEQIIRFREEGTSYWFAVGQKYGWFVSRGGKRVAGRSAGVLSNHLSLFLGFVPIPALRNVLSITSNWVENIADMSRGTYTKDWIKKFERAIVRTTINRSVRLTTRVVIGGKLVSEANKAVDKIETKLGDKTLNEIERTTMRGMLLQAQRKVDISKWVARELQRVSGTALTTFEGKTKDGYFKFTSGASKTRGAGENFARKMFGAALPTSIKSTVTRTARRRGAYTGIKLVGAKRDLSQIARTWSAVTPSGVPQLRTITKIRR